MRVAMLVWSYWPGHEGGAERQCRKLVEQAFGRGAEFLVLTSRYRYAAPAEESTVSARIVRLGLLAPLENKCRDVLERLISRVALLCGISSAGRIRSCLTAIQFWSMLPIVWSSRLLFIVSLSRWLAHNHRSIDLIHVHESEWLAGVAQFLGNRRNIPVLSKTATARALPTLGFDVPFRAKWNRLRKKCHFVCQHCGQVDDLLASGVESNQIFLLPNGVEIPEHTAQPGKVQEQVLYVGNFSQGSHWKAFDVLLTAWSQVHRRLPQAVLIMVGGGNNSPWKRLAEEYGCCESIVFQGAVPTVSPFYQQAVLFVLPSRVEGLSNALLEAQSYGLPCVVSDIPGNRAVIEDGRNGLVVPVGDAESLAQAIIALLMNHELRIRMGASARSRIIADFSMESVVPKLMQIYAQLVELGS